MKVLLAPLLPLLLLATSLQAWDLQNERFTQPSPDLGPAEVVEIQLAALQANDRPVPGTGIAQTWIFAHPGNKRVTGPLPRFARMMETPAYRLLLNHRSHTVRPVGEPSDGMANFMVRVVRPNGDAWEYAWRVERVEGGDLDGCWMTTAVSSPRPGESSI